MNETTTMPVTHTTNYRDVLNPNTLRVIDVFLEEEYNLSEMLVFIDKHGEIDFKYYFEDYKHWAGYHNNEVADFFVEKFGVVHLSDFQDCFLGENLSGEQIVDEYMEGNERVPDWVCIDYSDTVINLLKNEDVYRFVDSEGSRYYFRNGVY